MQPNRYYHETEELLSHLGWDSIAQGDSLFLEISTLLTTLLTSRGQDCGKFSRLFYSLTQREDWGATTTDDFAVHCIAHRLVAYSGLPIANQWTTQNEDKILQYLRKKIEGLTLNHQQLLWEKVLSASSLSMHPSIDTLLKMGCKADIELISKDNEQVSLLSFLTKSHYGINESIIKRLVMHGAPINGTLSEIKSPLQRAFERANEEMIMIFLDLGAEPVDSRLPPNLHLLVRPDLKRENERVARMRELALVLSEKVVFHKMTSETGSIGSTMKPRL